MKVEVESLLQEYISWRTPDEREASFDYCYNYFQTFREQKNIAALALLENMEKSCLHLGFYLASRGMFQGSSFILKKSLHHFAKVIEVIAVTNKDVWAIDICM